MGQVIEVRLMYPDVTKTLHESFTVASSHQEAIELALDEFSVGHAILKTMVKAPEEPGTFVGQGASRAYRYVYDCTIEPGDGKEDLQIAAVLFTQYKEKE